MRRHWLRVDLTHVDPGIVPLHDVQPERPAVVAVVLHAHPRVVGHHVRVDGEDRLRVRPEPSDLQLQKKKNRSDFIDRS